MLSAAGIKLPERENWANDLQRAKFNVDTRRAVMYNVVVFYNFRVKHGARDVYNKIRDFVNGFNSQYRFAEKPVKMVEAGDREKHWGAVETYFSGNVPTNIFVLDFAKPNRAAQDDAYPVVKQKLSSSG